jgi:hypothetical protein
MKVKPKVITVIGVLTKSPITRNTQPMPNPAANRSPNPASNARHPRLGPVAEQQADAQDDAARDGVAQDVAHHQPREGGERPDGERAEAVEQPLLEVGAEPHARIHRVEDHRLDEDAGQEELEVFAGAARQRAAEHEGEEQREHDGRHHEVEELLGHVLELENRAPAEDQRVGQRRGARRAADLRQRGGPGRRHRAPKGHLGHARASSACGRPVRAKNTSSRLGWPRRKSLTATPFGQELAQGAVRAGGVVHRDRQPAPLGRAVDGRAERTPEDQRRAVERARVLRRHMQHARARSAP